MTADPASKKLPFTAELGDEGGSYGDATSQAETFSDDRGNPRVDPTRVGVSGDETGAAAPEREQVRPSDDVVKPPSEPPDPPGR